MTEEHVLLIAVRAELVARRPDMSYRPIDWAESTVQLKESRYLFYRKNKRKGKKSKREFDTDDKRKSNKTSNQMMDPCVGQCWTQKPSLRTSLSPHSFYSCFDTFDLIDSFTGYEI
ncbi:hypothetical protein TNCV_906351 [Trichonephila clavipes]|nr:hypothetical protein TNCV_906351 [Trichonephila clavipes]